jgi:hypothetical protein
LALRAVAYAPDAPGPKGLGNLDLG